MANPDTLRQLVADVGPDTALKLMGLFQDDADKRLALIRAYLQDGTDGVDIGELRRNAHSLKGLCHTYGADAGGAAAMALQDACDDGNAQDIRAKAQIAVDVLSDDIKTAIRMLHNLVGV